MGVLNVSIFVSVAAEAIIVCRLAVFLYMFSHVFWCVVLGVVLQYLIISPYVCAVALFHNFLDEVIFVASDGVRPFNGVAVSYPTDSHVEKFLLGCLRILPSVCFRPVLGICRIQMK